MQAENSKALSSYFKSVKKCCPRAIRKRLMSELEDNVSEFLEENESAEIEDIINHFGKPEQIAEEYIAGLDDYDRKRLRSKDKWFKIGVVLSVIAVAVFAAIAAITVIEVNAFRENAYTTVEIIDEGWTSQD